MSDGDNSLKLKDKASQDANDSKRSFLKSAVGVAPVIMTVASRPVFGAQCTPSAWVSGNLSDHGKLNLTCNGHGPGYWKTNLDGRWNSTGFFPGSCKTEGIGTCSDYANDGTRFHVSAGGYTVTKAGQKVHSSGVFEGRRFGNMTLMQVLWGKRHNDPSHLGAHIVAALLNAASIPNYGMSVNTVKDIYRQLERNHSYKTSIGQSMNVHEVVLFLRNTF